MRNGRIYFVRGLPFPLSIVSRKYLVFPFPMCVPGKPHLVLYLPTSACTRITRFLCLCAFFTAIVAYVNTLTRYDPTWENLPLHFSTSIS